MPQRKQELNVSQFDYSAPAELFPSRIKKGGSQPRYKRFDTAAEAVRFAVEDIAPPALLGAYLEVDETRFDVHDIHQLYESAAFPLNRAIGEKSPTAPAAAPDANSSAPAK